MYPPPNIFVTPRFCYDPKNAGRLRLPVTMGRFFWYHGSMVYQKKGFFLCCGVFFLVFSACTARIAGNLEAGGAGEFEVSAVLMPRISFLIRSLSAALGDGTASGYIVDGEAIAQSMTGAPGIRSVSFRNTGPAAIEGPVHISRLEDFLAGANKSFIALEQAPAGGTGSSRCTITIDRESGPEILSLISADVSGYLSALMAPIATGEQLSKQEYLELVTSIYGQPVTDEIAQSVIRASIDFPGPVSAVRGGTWSGRRVELTVPLVDLLVLESPLVYEVWW
jgi:hypothetical protein